MRSNNLKTSKMSPELQLECRLVYPPLFSCFTFISFFCPVKQTCISWLFQHCQIIKMINYKWQSMSQLSLYLLFHPPFCILSLAPPLRVMHARSPTSLHSIVKYSHTRRRARESECTRTHARTLHLPLLRRHRAGRQLGSAFAFRTCTLFDAGTEAACDWH